MRRLAESRLFRAPAAPSYGAGDTRVGEMFASSMAVDGVRDRVPCATTFDPATGPGDGGCGLVVYFHGNAEDIGITAPRLRRLATALGMHAMAVEYPGYGPRVPAAVDDREGDGATSSLETLLSPSSSSSSHTLVRRTAPSERTAHAAARAAIRFALGQRWAERADDVVLWGTSLGGAVAARLAADMSRAGRPPGALIVASTFTTARDAARDLIGGPWWRLVGRDVFATLDHVSDVACPVLSLHGADDEIIPARHAGLLASACASDAWWRVSVAPGGSHNDLDDDGFVVPQVQAFLDDIAFGRHGE
ncbi:esterase FrsA incomplete domain containing protein [Pandoravirus japonicus]|uniref:Esterase FrsA incomplete domain containing protein n=1 Tax=Pandoravirus japonicus TaxID=2823154 RepID=A0A811BSD4_9VIRU|nr:esterase FrsA incomplete domain containing protein [Pandoravirus japonicus]